MGHLPRVLTPNLLKVRMPLFERSEFLIDTSQKKSLHVCCVHVCTRAIILVLVCRIMYHIRTYLISARLPRYVHPTLRTSVTLVVCIKTVRVLVTRALRCQLRGRPFHPWAGRLRFSGEAHPGPATLTQSNSFSCGAGLQSESRLLLCCAQRAPGTSKKKTERLVPASASLPTAGSALPPVGRATPLLW